MRKFNMMYEYGDKMTLTVSANNNKVTFEAPSDSTIHDFLEGCKILALGLSFGEHTWKEAILDLADEYRPVNARDSHFDHSDDHPTFS